MVHIISIANQKGGVAKTTTAHALAAGLHARGKKVLLVDLDAQCNLTYIAGITKPPQTIKEVLQGAEPKPLKCNTGDIIAGNAFIGTADLGAAGKEFRLKNVLAPIANNYDYIILDTPPSLSMLTLNALTFSGEVLIPTQADIFSLQGIQQLNNTIQAVKQTTNKELRTGGLLITRYSGNTILSKDLKLVMQKAAKELGIKLLNTVIREGIAVKEAAAKRADLFTYAPKSKAAQDYNNAINEILKGDAKK